MIEKKNPTQAGQYVKWLSAGPMMYLRKLVSRPGEAPTAECVWFSPDEHYHAVEIPVNELHVVEPLARLGTG